MTIKEIAQLAGVSVSTVSKIMNGKDESISSETRARVLKLAKEHHYAPYASVITGSAKSLTLGVIFNSLKNIDTTFKGIIDTAQEYGYTLMVCVSNNDSSLEYKHISALIQKRVDGILWETAQSSISKCRSVLDDAKIPYIIFGSDHPDSVNINYHEMSYQATRLLIENHHSEIGCLLSNGHRTKEVLQGYRKCLFDYGITYQPDFVFNSISQNLLNKLSSHTVSGIVSSHYSAALDLYEVVHTLHYSLPHDFSLVSLRGDSHRSLAYPNISSYTIPYYDFGGYICRLLIARLESNAQPEPDFTPKITVNNTTTVDIPYNTQGKKILVIGSINIDNYLCVDTLPHSGKAVISSITHQYPGGKAMNQAVGVSKMGHQVSLIGNVGNDLDADAIFATIHEHHINPRGVCRHSDAKTGQAYIFVQKDGNSMISIMSGANITLTPETIRINQNLFENTEFCLIQTEIPLETVETACMVAKQNHAQTILKPAACGPLPASILKLVDYLIPNEEELSELCPHLEGLEARAEYLLEQGVKTIIVTLGPNGCYLQNRQTRKYFPAADFQSIDSSGACDAFISALASYLLYGYDLETSIQTATCAAGFSVTREGVIPSLVDKNTLESYIRQKGFAQ